MIKLFTTAWSGLNADKTYQFIDKHKCKKDNANIIMKPFKIEGKNDYEIVDGGVVMFTIPQVKYTKDFNKMCIEEIENEIKTNYPKLYGSYKEFKETRKITLIGRKCYGKLF